MTSIADNPGPLLWQVTNRWQAAQRAVLKPLGLTPVQFVLLASLAELTGPNGPNALTSDGDGVGPVTQRELAEYAATDPMMTSQVVRVLEANGWIKREVHPADGRAWALRVTRSGAALARRAKSSVEKRDKAFFGALGSREQAFVRALRSLRDGTE